MQYLIKISYVLNKYNKIHIINEILLWYICQCKFMIDIQIAPICYKNKCNFLHQCEIQADFIWYHVHHTKIPYTKTMRNKFFKLECIYHYIARTDNNVLKGFYPIHTRNSILLLVLAHGNYTNIHICTIYLGYFENIW